MTPEEGYREAEQRIELARQEGATELDLRNLALTEVPESIGQLTHLEKLALGGLGDSKNQLTELPDAIAKLRVVTSPQTGKLKKTQLNLSRATPFAPKELCCENSIAFKDNQIGTSVFVIITDGLNFHCQTMDDD